MFLPWGRDCGILTCLCPASIVPPRGPQPLSCPGQMPATTRAKAPTGPISLSWFLSPLQIFYCEIHSTLVAGERAVKIASIRGLGRVAGNIDCGFAKENAAAENRIHPGSSVTNENVSAVSDTSVPVYYSRFA